MDKSPGIFGFHSFLLMAILCLAVLGLSACGKDEPPSPQQQPQQEQKADTTPVQDLLNIANQQKESPKKPAILENLTGDINLGSGNTIGDDQIRDITLENEGDEPLTIKNITLNPQNVTEFVLGGNCLAGVVLDPSRKACRLEVTFRPVNNQKISASIVITHTGQNDTLIIQLSGSGAEAYIPPEIAQEKPTEPTQQQIEAMRLQMERRQGRLSSTPSLKGQLRNQWIMSDADYKDIGYGKTTATFPIDRTRMITSDRYIPAVLENTISSQIPKGRVIAVIENHVYSAEGRNILIPAGSRAIGEYDGSNKAGTSRLTVVWNRIIRPDGVGINVRSPSADPMGRVGLIGDVDNRLFDRFGVPLLISAIGVAANYAASPSQVTTTTTTGALGVLGTSTSETTTRENQAARQFSADAVQKSQEFIQNTVSLQPIITVPAGTRFVILPTQDIEFKSPQLLTVAGEAGNIVSQAQALIRALQRGDIAGGSERLIEIIGQVSKAGAMGQPGFDTSGSPTGAFGVDNSGTNQVGGAANSYGPGRSNINPPINKP